MTPERPVALEDADRVETPPETLAESGHRPRRPDVAELVRAHGLVGLLYALAAVPVISMFVEVIRSPRLQFYDYWFVLARVANPDGSLNFRGVFTYRNEHPTFVPGLIYWLETRLLDGSNPPLGLLSVVMAAATVVLLVYLLPNSINGFVRAALAVAFAFLVLSPQGLHNFVMGMSGTSWLLANLTAVAAFLALRGNRYAVAIGLAVFACLCYGTGFALWPGLAVALWLRREKLWKVLLPLGIGVVIVGIWAVTLDSLNPGPETGSSGLEDLVAGIAGTAGSLWGDFAPIAGLITLVLLGIATVITARRRIEPTAPAPAQAAPSLADAGLWVGLAVYAVGGIGMIALARAEEGLDALLTSRYASMPALATCALLGLGAMYVRRVRPAVAVTLLLSVALTTYALSAPRSRTVRDNFPKQSAIAVAMHVGAVHAIVPEEFPLVSVESARNMGAYPFTSDFTLGCGGPELGDWVDLEAATSLPPAPGFEGNRGTVDLARNLPGADGQATGWYISGWALIGNRRADCVLVVDGGGTVVGGGAVDVRRRDVVAELVVDEAHSGFMAVAAPTVTDPIVVLKSGGAFYRLDLGN